MQIIIVNSIYTLRDLINDLNRIEVTTTRVASFRRPTRAPTSRAPAIMKPLRRIGYMASDRKETTVVNSK